jgi:hypothetical protein
MQEKAIQVRNTRNAVIAFSETIDTTFGLEDKLFDPPEKLEVVTKDKDLLNRFFNEVLMYRGASGYMQWLIIRLRGRAVSLIKYYTEKYHLK